MKSLNVMFRASLTITSVVILVFFACAVMPGIAFADSELFESTKAHIEDGFDRYSDSYDAGGVEEDQHDNEKKEAKSDTGSSVVPNGYASNDEKPKTEALVLSDNADQKKDNKSETIAESATETEELFVGGGGISSSTVTVEQIVEDKALEETTIVEVDEDSDSFEAIAVANASGSSDNVASLRVLNDNATLTAQVSSSSTAGRPVDFIFVVDTTGSMGDNINNVRSMLTTLVSRLRDEYLIDMNMSVVEYRDYYVDGGANSVGIHHFGANGDRLWSDNVNSVSSIFGRWNKSYVGGGGDLPETPTYAISRILDEVAFRSYSDRFVFLLSDAGYKTGGAVPSMNDTISRLNEQYVHAIVVNTRANKSDYSSLFNNTDGAFIDIDSSSSSFLSSVVSAIGGLTKKSYDTHYSNVSFAECVYNGSYLKPSMSVILSGKVLVEGRDYRITWGNNKNAGSTAYAIVEGIGLYEGTKTATFTIAPATLSSCNIKFNTVTYCGQARTPIPTRISYYGMNLVKGTDYRVISYTNNVNVGIARVVLRGVGNYSGDVTVDFEIRPAQIAWATFAVPSVVYNGRARTPQPNNAIWSQLHLNKGSDYRIVYYGNNINVGVAYITIDGVGNYAGRTTVSFEIKPASISWAGIKMPAVTYCGTELTPKPASVVWNGMSLKEGRDYSIFNYYHNVNANDGAYIVIDGLGNYAGRKTADFVISPAQLSWSSIEVPSVTYNGSYRTPAPSSVTWNGMDLIKGKDYRIAGYYHNVNANDGAYAVLDGLGNYCGRTTVAFQINPASVSWAVFHVPEVTYTGTPRTPAPSSAFWNGLALGKDVDYKVSAYYRNTVANGGAYVVIDGIGNYCGRTTAEFTIVPAMVSWAEVSFERVTYDRSAKLPEITKATWNGNVLKPGRDYRVAYYSNNINASSNAFAIIEGVGNYAGRKTAYFTISPESIAVASLSVPDVIYTGFARTPAPLAKWKGIDLVRGVDYRIAGYYRNTIANGGAYIVLDGIGNFVGRTTVSFCIKPASLSWASIIVNDVTYSGSERTPAPSSVTWNGQSLVRGTDYKVLSFGNNVNASDEACMVLQGIGNYEGILRTSFTIKQAKISWCEVQNLQSRVYYTGQNISFSPMLKYGGMTIDEGRDYILRYVDDNGAYVVPRKTGVYQIIIHGIGNFMSQISYWFEVVSY